MTELGRYQTSPIHVGIHRCDSQTAADDRCSRIATWVRLARGETEYFCTRHANLIISENGRCARPNTWRRIS